MNQKLILSDGTELANSYAVQAGGNLWVYVYAQISFAALFGLLNDPAKTDAITLSQGGTETEFDGYDELFCIRKEDGGFISAGLRK